MFDDGFSDIYDVALPILERYQYRAGVAIIGSKIGKKKYLTAGQIRELTNLRWSLLNHTYTHPNINKISIHRFTYEIKKNQLLIKRLFGIDVNGFVFPQSKITPQALSIALSHHPMVFTGVSDVISNTPPFYKCLLKRTEMSLYEIIKYALRGKNFPNELIGYLKKIMIEGRDEWAIIFTHHVKKLPGLFDSPKALFSLFIDEIHRLEIPVITPDDILK